MAWHHLYVQQIFTQSLFSVHRSIWFRSEHPLIPLLSERKQQKCAELLSVKSGDEEMQVPSRAQTVIDHNDSHGKREGDKRHACARSTDGGTARETDSDCEATTRARSRLTAGDLKSIVQEDAVPRRIAGVEDLPVLHDDLGVERDPPASGLLSGG